MQDNCAACACPRCAAADRTHRRTNALLCVMAAMLLALLLRDGGGAAESAAIARPPAGSGSGGIPNPADDRARMLQAFERMNQACDAIRARLEKPLTVEVAKMPASKPAHE